MAGLGDLIKRTAKDSGQSQRVTRLVLVSFLAMMREALAKGDDVTLSLFGRFHVKKGLFSRLDWESKKSVLVPSFRISFRAAGKLKDEVKERYDDGENGENGE